MNYYDVVLVKHMESGTKKIYKAPSFSHLKEGDLITVDGYDGEKTANVISSITLRKGREGDYDTLCMLMAATDTETLFKVTSHIIYEPMNYKYDEDEEGESGELL